MLEKIFKNKKEALKNLEALQQEKEKGFNFDLKNLSEDERFEVIKLAIKKGVDWDVEKNIKLIPKSRMLKITELMIKAGQGIRMAESLEKMPMSERGKSYDLITEHGLHKGVYGKKYGLYDEQEGNSKK